MLPGCFSQIRCPLEIVRRKSVPEGFVQVLVRLIPSTGAKVKFSKFFGLTKSLAQQIAKQMMVAIPTPFLVELTPDATYVVRSVQLQRDQNDRRGDSRNA